MRSSILPALLAPADRLMRRLRLLPKFGVLTLTFIAPLLLVTGLLVKELQRAIDATVEERTGVAHILLLQDMTRLLQHHRAVRHMALSGNASAKALAAPLQTQIAARIEQLDRLSAGAAHFGATDEWDAVKQSWAALQRKLPATAARESQAEHGALIAHMQRFTRLIADRSSLSLDPEIGSFHLMTAFVTTFPGIADNLSQIGGRGAAYIDTGLLEANEDLLLSSSVMLARRDLTQVPAQFDAVSRALPSLQKSLTGPLAAVQTAQAFLERAQSEVITSYNQTSGLQFQEAARKSIDALYAAAAQTGALLDAQLQERIARDTLRRNLMLGAVFCALGMAAYLLAGFFTSFLREIRQLDSAVARAAGGDLSQRIDSNARDEIGGLTRAFGGMNGGLARLVGEVRTGSESIRHVSREIAAGNADLSARTEAQASSLQQTASAMEQLTATVRRNAGNAKEAERMAQAAADAARTGRDVVRNAVGTMAAIKASSGEIGKIISVIDGIAFQTNLLALNAAVEAARAGAQGRGFAVVAAEVRQLAHRSADSARQIKRLIENSVERIDAGGALVNAAGATMEDIVAAVHGMAELMADISTASDEQTTGIESVNQAVGHIDRMTQQNALLVEQAAHSAESLQTHAMKLSQAVSAFKLADLPAAPAPSAYQAASAGWQAGAKLAPPATPPRLPGAGQVSQRRARQRDAHPV
jgi:methyl-accepting chemotaxis protein